MDANVVQRRLEADGRDYRRCQIAWAPSFESWNRARKLRGAVRMRDGWGFGLGTVWNNDNPSPEHFFRPGTAVCRGHGIRLRDFW
jgi:hypothetical protein